ncbi:hypothetical protein [Kangiella shandongensis]|uniref:hypothetical protein n=1 Tax=Kangiella shandongensis TaxID=2763258 RepID=UPI001CBD62F4|nr:hypothetical protein [Kangiella shandongensis]
MDQKVRAQLEKYKSKLRLRLIIRSLACVLSLIIFASVMISAYKNYNNHPEFGLLLVLALLVFIASITLFSRKQKLIEKDINRGSNIARLFSYDERIQTLAEQNENEELEKLIQKELKARKPKVRVTSK